MIGFFASFFKISKEKNQQKNLLNDLKYEICDLAKLDFNVNLENKKAKPNCMIEQNWGYVDPFEHKWIINQKISLEIDLIKCKKRKIERIDDFKINFGLYTELKNGDIVNDEVFEVDCQGKNRKNNNLLKFKNVYVQIVTSESEKQSDETKLNTKGCYSYNVMLLSYDSVSQVSFMNRLKKTVDLIKKTDNFHIFNGYNIVGDGTPAGKNKLYLFK